MPTYCYETEEGEIIERQFPMGKAPDVIYPEGPCAARCKPLARRCLAAEIIGQVATVKGTDTPVTGRRKSWPLKCSSSGVHPSQAQDLRDHYKKHGLSVHVDKEGDPHYEDASQRRKALKCRGMNDRNDHFG